MGQAAKLANRYAREWWWNTTPRTLTTYPDVGVVPALYWPMDESSGNLIAAVGGLNLTETSGTIGTTTGLAGAARDFVASDTEYFTVNDDPLISMGDIDFEIQAVAGLRTTSGFKPLLAHQGGGGELAYLLWHRGDTNRWQFRVSTDGVTLSTGVSSAVVCAADTPYSVRCWHDSVNNLIGISVNNETPVTVSHTTGVFNGTGVFRVGEDAGFGSYFDGWIQHVLIFKNTLLTTNQRTLMHNMFFPSNEAEIIAKEWWING